MAKYLIHGSYTLEGVRGFLKEGASSRRSHVKEFVGNLGAKWKHSTTLSEETTSMPS